MKAFILTMLIFLTIPGKSQVQAVLNDSIQVTKNVNPIENSAQILDSVVNFGKSLEGCHYKYGGSSLSGFDCSGFIRFIFRKYGYSFPHCSREFVNIGEEISKDSIRHLKKGDILLFRGRNLKSKKIGHISIIAEVNENEILMLHSCCDKGVAVENFLASGYYPERLVEIRRIKEL
jgi:gamma-D-glutamyl-L-lysine dipeptidyl-peptidase